MVAILGLIATLGVLFGNAVPNQSPTDVAKVCSSQLSRAIPERSPDAPSGSQFVERIWDLRGRERDEVVLAELARGNLPDFLRELKPVTLTSRDRHGVRHLATVCVMPDYLAVGSDEDFVRLPLGFRAATRVARDFGFILPTRKIVDAVYQQAALRLPPMPMRPGREMVSTRYVAAHNETIERVRREQRLGELVSGHKKDLVLTKRLLTRRGRVAIYGWHQRPGHPIQPLSTVHGARYADYSHGVRLVSDTVLLNGRSRSIYEVLSDRAVANTLTHEGIIRDAARLMGIASTRSTSSAE
jgi:hypothetical protein